MLFLKRIGLILLGYALAALASGYVVAIAARIDGRGIAPSGTIWMSGIIVTAFIAVFASAPALVVILVGEIWKFVKWWYYSVSGALIGFGLGAIFMQFWEFQILGLGFGIVAGLIYWFFAGKNAGELNVEATIEQHRLLLALLIILLSIVAVWAGSVFF